MCSTHKLFAIVVGNQHLVGSVLISWLTVFNTDNAFLFQRVGG